MAIWTSLDVLRFDVPNSERSRHSEPPSTLPCNDHHISGLFCSHDVNICIILFFIDANGTRIIHEVDHDCSGVGGHMYSRGLRWCRPFDRLTGASTGLNCAQSVDSYKMEICGSCTAFWHSLMRSSSLEFLTLILWIFLTIVGSFEAKICPASYRLYSRLCPTLPRTGRGKSEA